MSVFFVFFCFFGAKIWPAAADTGELGWDLRDPTPPPRRCLSARVWQLDLQQKPTFAGVVPVARSLSGGPDGAHFEGTTSSSVVVGT